MSAESRMTSGGSRVLRKLPRLLAAVSAACILAVVTLSGAAPANASGGSPTKCGFGIFIAVRGTGETGGSSPGLGGRTWNVGGLGRLIGVASDFGTDPELPFWVESLNYPAQAGPFTGLADPIYDSSIATGTTTLRAEIESIATSCPYTNILLAGYSQGAQVIGNVLASNSSPQLSSAARSHISSVVLMADPSYRVDQPYDDVRNGTANGVYTRPAGVLNSWTRISWDTGSPVVTPIIHSWCWDNDQWCQGGIGPSAPIIHGSYGAAATQLEAYNFMRPWLISQG